MKLFFHIETVFTLNWIVTYNCLNSLRWKGFWQLNCVLMLNWIVLNRTDYLHKNGFGINGWYAIKPNQTKPNRKKIVDFQMFSILMFAAIILIHFVLNLKSFKKWQSLSVGSNILKMRYCCSGFEFISKYLTRGWIFIIQYVRCNRFIYL